MQNYTLRILDQSNVNDLNQLFEKAFKQPPLDGFIQWKYFQNPFGSTIVAGVFYADQLVASGAMLPEHLAYKGKNVTVYKCTDLMTDPDHQGKGLSKMVNKELKERSIKAGAPFFYTLCSKIATKSFRKNDWNYLEKVTNFFKPVQSLKITRAFAKSNSSFRHFDGYNDQLQDFAFNNEGDKIQIFKTADFIKWRTSDPNFSYHLICSYDSNNVLNGYLIYSIDKANLLNIIDVEVQEESLFKKLIKEAELTAVKNNRKGVLVMAVKGTQFYDRIKKLRYFQNPIDKGPLVSILDFNVYEIDAEFKDISQLKNWDLKAINYDNI